MSVDAYDYINRSIHKLGRSDPGDQQCCQTANTAERHQQRAVSQTLDGKDAYAPWMKMYFEADGNMDETVFLE